jgi:hypothetical protein
MKLKGGDIHLRTRGDLTTILWRDKLDIHMLTNIPTAPAEGKDSGGKAIKPQIVIDCNHHMVYGK